MSTQIIAFNCILKNKAGKLISTTFNREVLNAVDVEQNGVLSGLTKGLQNLKKGEKRKIALMAEEAYGLYYPNKVIFYPRKQLSKDIRIGETIGVVGKSGILTSYVVLEIFQHFVRLDGNHPLAGQDLVFEIEALDARDATPEEMGEVGTGLVSQRLH